MDRLLIINADDYGLDLPANEAILALAADGAITSTTILANMAGDRELAALREVSGISRGLHLNLLEGTPLSPASEVPSLLNSDGAFHPQKELLLRSLTGRISALDLEREVGAQVERLRQAGIEPSHVDSHKHVHQYPGIGPMILKILRRLGVKKVRNCRVSDRGSLKMLVVGLFSLITSRGLRPFTTPDVLLSGFSAEAGAGLEGFCRDMERAAAGNRVLEFMTHPATSNSDVIYLDRAAEYRFWAGGEWREWLQRQGIGLITYDQLGA
jgi:predicted glycoside hydrolase/deacetylase ChbG (UPF0249 family)